MGGHSPPTLHRRAEERGLPAGVMAHGVAWELPLAGVAGGDLFDRPSGTRARVRAALLRAGSGDAHEVGNSDFSGFLGFVIWPGF